MTNISIPTNRFLLYLLGKNIEPTCYTEVIEDYAAQLPDRQKNGKSSVKDHDSA